jgi:hypothetical protein
MKLITFEDITFNPSAIDLIRPAKPKGCEVFFRGGSHVLLKASAAQFAAVVAKTSEEKKK